MFMATPRIKPITVVELKTCLAGLKDCVSKLKAAIALVEEAELSVVEIRHTDSIKTGVQNAETFANTVKKDIICVINGSPILGADGKPIAGQTFKKG
jgi:hypothetical protein